jgi:hypothetical protein
MILILLQLEACNTRESVYRRIRNHEDQIRVINTHEHQHQPSEYGNYKFGFYQVLAASYLAWDISSSGVNGADWKLFDSLNLDQLWNRYGDAFNHTRNTTYYSHFAEGFRRLYVFNDRYFTKKNIAVLSSRIEDNYKDYNSWFDYAFRKSGYEIMFLDQYWNPFNTDIDTAHFALAFNINALISSSSRKPAQGNKPVSVYREAQKEGFQIQDFDDYLDFCDHLIKLNIKKKAVCLKNAQAYSRTLYYADVPYDEAKRLFEKPSSELAQDEAKKIEDFMFHFIIRKAAAYEMPIQIHTGLLASNSNTLDNGQPLKLNNLFMEYPDTKFILFHGGFPWTGECAALAKMFPNVYLDLVWLPQISREQTITALDMMLDCVPYNKFCWGGDSGLIEESTGSLVFAKDIVAEVLTRRIERGLLTEDVALEISDAIFRNNAIEIFRLKGLHLIQ